MNDLKTLNHRDDLLRKAGELLACLEATASEFSDLARQMKAEAATASSEAATWRTRSYDPVLPSIDVKAARQAAEDASFEADRLLSLASRLETRALDLAYDEHKAAERDEYARISGEAARCAGRIEAEYPAIHASFLDLLADIARTNAEVDRMNRSLPDGFEKIQRPEGRARGFHDKDDMAGGGAPYNYEIVRLIQCVLPSLTGPSLADWPRGLRLDLPNARSLRLPKYGEVQARAAKP